ncbi:hypothetical protein BHM03_00027081 [Ensete ventricosum]|nr:hypothetical protein BHM03_00027081 [Ensete ventricosum]
MIASTEEPKLEDMTPEPKEKDTPQSATRTVPTLVGYTNLQILKIEGFLEQHFVIILIGAGSTHNFMSNISSDLSLQSVYIAARSNLSLPTILIVANVKVNTTAAVSRSIPLLPSSAIAVHTAASSSSYCSRTLAATNATCSYDVAAQPQPTSLLPFSSSTVDAAFRLRSIGYNLPTDISHLKNRSLNDITASL